MLQKKFHKDSIQKVLSESREYLHDPELYKNILIHRRDVLIKKGFSRKAIIYELSSDFPQFRELIDAILQEYDAVHILQTIVLPKLQKQLPEQKIIEKCLQRGFSLSDIKKVLADFDN